MKAEVKLTILEVRGRNHKYSDLQTAFLSLVS